MDIETKLFIKKNNQNAKVVKLFYKRKFKVIPVGSIEDLSSAMAIQSGTTLDLCGEDMREHYISCAIAIRHDVYLRNVAEQDQMDTVTLNIEDLDATVDKIERQPDFIKWMI
jgi:hypothetical protein